MMQRAKYERRADLQGNHDLCEAPQAAGPELSRAVPYHVIPALALFRSARTKADVDDLLEHVIPQHIIGDIAADMSQRPCVYQSEVIGALLYRADIGDLERRIGKWPARAIVYRYAPGRAAEVE